MKNLIKKIPGFSMANKWRRHIKSFFNLFQVYIYDLKRYLKYYTIDAQNKYDKKSIESWILQDKHRLEKGLSLPSPRDNFGEEVIIRLVDNTLQYSSLFEKDQVYYIAIGAIKAYCKHHSDKETELKVRIRRSIDLLPMKDFMNENCDLVGVKPQLELKNNSKYFREFTQTRTSCRNFDNSKLISDEVLFNVMDITIKTPSVCNRQHWKAHIFSGSKKLEILGLQNGNTGFTENIPYLAVITSDLKSFYMPSERTQPFTDGGMFAMSFIYALHSHGISSCALNWCTQPKNNEKLYEITNINDSESVIMLIAFGYPNSEAKNALSPRLPTESFYTLTES